jgi:hypothetical protein
MERRTSACLSNTISTRLEFLRKLDVIGLADRLRDHVPDELYKSLTWHRGKEMATRKRFTLATDIKALESGH